MALVATTGLWLSRSQDHLAQAPPIVDASGMVRAMASGAMRFSCSSNMVLYSDANVMIGAGSMPDVVTVGSNLLIVNGDVHVRGAIESYTSTEINLQDKVIRLAYPLSNVAGVSDAYLDGSGVLLADNAASNYEKSIRWHASPRMSVGSDAQVRPGGASNEPYWEVLGGGLRLSSKRPTDGSLVSYGLHINEREELEVYKRWTSAAGQERFQRITAFGGSTTPFPPALTSLI